MSEPLVSVIIPTHNRKHHVLTALQHLSAQDYSVERYEVIVVADRCTDGTAEAVAERFNNRVCVLESDAAGQAAALNTGIGASSGELLIFLDDEMTPVPGFVRAHVEAHKLASDLCVAITGFSPVIIDADASPLERDAAERFARFHSRMASSDRKNAPTDVNGGNFSISRRALEEVGGFNAGYFFQRNDFELAARLMEKGYNFAYSESARADQRVAVSADSLVNRAEPRAVNDLRLASEFPRCVEFLPFYAIAKNQSSNRKWRILWLAHRFAPEALAAARRLIKDNVTLVNWEYTSRYVAALRKELRDWHSLIAIVRNAQHDIQ